MRIVWKVILFTVLVALFIGGSAFAITSSEGMGNIPISEPAALCIFGSSLIVLGAFSRRFF